MAELVALTAPSDQAEGTEMTVATWFKQVGDAVTENEPLLEISTDKVTVEVASPASGVLREIRKPAGETVDAGEVLGHIDTGGTAAETGSAAGAAPALAAAAGTATAAAVAATGTSAAASAVTELTPAVRRLLAEHGLDAAQVIGTGRGGRITVQDVEAYLAARTAHPASAGAAPATAGPSAIPSRKVPHSAMRRSIAQHMAQSVATAPHVTSVFEADLSAIIAHREAHRAAFEADGIKLTYTAYFVRASVLALQAVPEANSRWHEDALELFEDCNIGVATALGTEGLIVPVIHRAQTLDLRATAAALQDLTQRARAGTLAPRDVQQGTFSISNHGVSGSLIAAPIIIPQPQSAILGIGKLERRPVAYAKDGHEVVEVRPRCYVTLTIDHRVLDGFQANAFLTRWVAAIENAGEIA